MSTPENPLIFVYGTLKTGHGNNPLLVRHSSLFMGPAITVRKFLLNDGFPVVFTPPENPEPVAMFLGHVRGEVWAVTEDGLLACDHLEGHPHAYCRTPIEVTYVDRATGDEHVVTAGAYLMTMERRFPDLQKPDKEGFLEWGRARRRQAMAFQADKRRR